MHTSGIVLVSGASSGIGRHAAISLSKSGYFVLAGVRKVEDVIDMNGLHIDNLEPILLDITSTSSITTAVDYVRKIMKLKGLLFVGLVNNAGVMIPPLPVEFYDMSAVRYTFDTNYFGTFELTKSCIPLLRESEGRVILISSDAGLVSLDFWSVYSATKYAIEALGDSLRREVAHMAVSVSLIQPGFIRTDIAMNMDRAYSNSAMTVSQSALMRDVYGHRVDAAVAYNYEAVAKGGHTNLTSHAILDAMSNPCPRTRYVVTSDGHVSYWLSLLPTRLADYFILHILK